MAADPMAAPARAPDGRLATVAAAAIVVALHVFWLGRYPTIAADEGGWPIAVRTWIEQGRFTFDCYQAPAYCWILGAAFRWFGPTVVVGRETAALFNLAGLAFFAGAAYRLFGDRRTALWALVLLGIDYTTVLTDRRAYIEPFQMFWMHAVVFLALGHRRRDAIALVVAVAGLLLTKANGIFVLVMLVAASMTDRPAPAQAARRRTWTALAVGTACAGVVFLLLYRINPQEFLLGWAATMHGVPVRPGNGPGHVDGVIRFGFVIIDPKFGFTILRVLSAQAPFGLALATAATTKSLLERRVTLVGWWFCLSLAAVLIQAIWLENHLAVVYPSLALGTAWLLTEADRLAPKRRFLGATRTWPQLFFAVIVAYDLTQFAGGLATTPEPSVAAVRWLDRHARPTDVVLAAPYIIMQRESPGRSFWELAPPYLPAPAQMRAWHVRWVVVDRKEWIAAQRYQNADPAAMDSALKACCTPMYPAPRWPTSAPVEIFAVQTP
jgi:hypothetical protein